MRKSWRPSKSQSREFAEKMTNGKILKGKDIIFDGEIKEGKYWNGK